MGHTEAGDSRCDTQTVSQSSYASAEHEAELIDRPSIDHYEIERRLGTGGMGAVWLARDTRLGRKVALKLLKAEFTHGARRLQRFLKEARAASALNHPNIITIYEVGECNGSHFIAMEFIEGVTLRRHMGDRRMDLKEAMPIARQIAAALETAHRAGIIHRDMKPENVMLRPDGLLKILDFGLARAEPVPGTDSSSEFQTETGMVMGTPRYMSPEQAQGKIVDRRTDVFSVGTIVYEMLAGHSPFPGQSQAEVFAALLAREPPPPLADPALDSVLRRALAKMPEDRYGSMCEFAADLEAVQDSITTAASRATPSTMPAPVPPEVLRQLERILAHPLLRKSRRLSAFLRYVVENTLAGETDQLKELVIGTEVFKRGAGFDPQTDNVVRVNANRLRSKLAEYYQQSGAADPILISIPRGGYVPCFSWAQRNEPPMAQFQRPANAGRPNPAVGRRLELGRLREAFGTASGGIGVLATVSGDAGMGKTTTVEQFLSEFEAIKGRVWIARGRCSERLAQTDAFVAVLDCLDDLVRNAPETEVLDLLRTVGPTWLAQLRPGQDRSDPILAKGDVISHERMRREFVNFLEAITAIRPAIVFVDDLHWADPSTCDLLAYLGSRMSALRLLIIATYRPGEVLKQAEPFFSTILAMRRRGSSTDLTLPLLTESDIEEYLTIRFPQNSFPAEFKAVIQERTEGKPLFMTDLLDYLVETRVLTATNDTWSLGLDIDAVRRTIPLGARSVTRLKIEQLGEGDRSILQCAAVQGFEFDSAVVARALAIDPANVEERLQVLESIHRLVHLVDERAFPEGTLSARYRFLHVFYQNTLYADLTPTRRTRLCLEVANSLASLAPGDTGGLASELAFLFEAGRDYDNASRYFQQAATQAAKVFAYAEATVLCESGLKCLMRLPESTERDTKELTLSLTAGMAMMATLGYAAPQVEAIHRRSRQLCLGLNQERRLVQVLWALHTCHINAGDLDSALELAMEMRELAGRLDSPAAKIESLHALGTTLAFLGKLVEAREALEGIFKICPVEQFIPRRTVYLLDPCVTSLSMLARLLALLGHVDEAIAKACLSVDVANRILHLPTLAYATFWVGWIRHQRGEHAEACVHLEAAMTLSNEHGLPLIREWCRIVRGSALTHLNRVEEGVAEMQRSLEAQTAMRCRLERAYCLTLLAEGLVMANRNDEALSLCDQAHAVALETQALGYEPEAHRVRALALLAIGRESVRAEQELEAALDLARRTQSRLLELRAATAYSQLQRNAEPRETLVHLARESGEP